MSALTPTHRLENGHRLISLETGTQTGGWISKMSTVDIADGFMVNLFDFVTDHQEELVIEGPPTFSISLFLQGAGRFSVENGKSLDVQPDCLFLFYTSRRVRGRNLIAGQTSIRGVDFRFDPNLLNKLGLHTLGCLMCSFDDDGSVQDTLLFRRRLDQPLRQIALQCLACRMTGVARRVYLQSKALEVLSHLIHVTDHQAFRKKCSLSVKDHDRIQAAADILRQRYQEPWTISLLAREVGVNERKLKEGFRQVLGRTVHDHLEKARILAAQALLSREEVAVTEAALAVGYSNPSHFAKVFKRHLGSSPRDWRRLR